MNVSRVRCIAVWLAVTGTALGVAWLALPDARAFRAGPARFDELLVRACAATAIGCAAWLWLGATAVLAATVRGRPTPRRCLLPATVRRALLGACGVALASGLVVPAGASEPGSTPDQGPPAVATLLDGLPLPDRAADASGPRVAGRPAPAAAAPARSTGPAPSTGRSVTVRPGDTLWAIAAADLPGGAEPDEVDRHWRLLHDLNRDLLGPDPDLIHPGQRLRLP